jgi:uncharacterized membrane protein YozB (DUF420 family)
MLSTITALILFGFSHTVESDVIHPAEAQPAILYVHVVTYTLWLAILLTQSALVWSRNVRLHRRLGWMGAAFAAGMVVIGLLTTVIMGRLQVQRMGQEAGMFIFRPFEDILFFAAAFGLAVHWRKRPDAHRRLMVLASCALTPPAISRIPGIHSLSTVYLGTDLLVMAAMMYDLILLRRVHAIYRWGFAIAVLGQTGLLLVMADKPAPFVTFARLVTG